MSNNLIVVLSNKLKELNEISKASKLIQNQTAGRSTDTQLNDGQYF